MFDPLVMTELISIKRHDGQHSIVDVLFISHRGLPNVIVDVLVGRGDLSGI